MILDKWAISGPFPPPFINNLTCFGTNNGNDPKDFINLPEKRLITDDNRNFPGCSYVLCIITHYGRNVNRFLMVFSFGIVRGIKISEQDFRAIDRFFPKRVFIEDICCYRPVFGNEAMEGFSDRG